MLPFTADGIEPFLATAVTLTEVFDSALKIDEPPLMLVDALSDGLSSLESRRPSGLRKTIN